MLVQGQCAALPRGLRLPLNNRPERCVKTSDDKVVSEHTVCVKVADYRLPGTTHNVDREHEHKPRDPKAGLSDLPSSGASTRCTTADACPR